MSTCKVVNLLIQVKLLWVAHKKLQLTLRSGIIDFVSKTDPEGAAKLLKTEDDIRAAIEAGNNQSCRQCFTKKKSKKLDDPEEKA